VAEFFQPGIAPRQIVTLILQGGCNSCTSSMDFSHWTLVMQGPKPITPCSAIW
jgi:hypothetical protein